MRSIGANRSTSKGTLMNIGEPLRIIEVEPLCTPMPGATPAPVQDLIPSSDALDTLLDLYGLSPFQTRRRCS